MDKKTFSTNDLVFYNTKAHYPSIAAIDLGTNSCRILVATVNIINLHRNFFKLRCTNDRQMKIVDSFACVVGLGEGLKQTGLLSKNAIDRTLEALDVCRQKLEIHHVCYMRAVATEACRQASNANILLEKSKNEIGIELEIITPQEEAQLVLNGCMGVMCDSYSYGITLDIGGGSTEVIWLRIRKNKIPNKPTISVIDSMSLPYGVVTLRDTYTHDDYNSQTYITAQQAISQAVSFFMSKNRIKEHLKKNEVQIVASSGTVTTLASLVLGLKSYDRKAIDGQDFKSSDLQRIGNNLLSRYLNRCSNVVTQREQEFLAHRMCDVSSELASQSSDPFMYSRVGLLAAGTVILNAIIDVFGQHNLRIADRGVREGILHGLSDLLRENQTYF